MAALVRRCAHGDREALALVYDRTASQVNGLALHILSDREMAEEVTLDVFLQVWRTAASYDPLRAKPIAWLMMLTRSRAIDRLRRRAPHEPHTETLAAAGALAVDAPGPEDRSAAGQERRLVRGALDLLGAEQRQCVELAYFRGLSHREIAETLHQPLGTIKSRIRLAMARLRGILEPRMEDGS